ncbi:EAL domain-containing protein [Deinococcus altitudinis]|uniref:EAL domain-containing protein n=1 Tax=Deinococcus altitudinis TaxID=468914 RepID=UPI003891B9CA
MLDDFGHGYSSLMALTSLPVQMVKIDRSFTTGIGEDTSAGNKVLKALHRTVALATRYRLPTVAEGVETLEQADLLTKAGCAYLQGHFFGRPEPLI